MTKRGSVRVSVLARAALLCAVLPFAGLAVLAVSPAHAAGGGGGSANSGGVVGGIGGNGDNGVAGTDGTSSGSDASGGGGGSAGGGSGGKGGGGAAAGIGGTSGTPNGSAGANGTSGGGGGGGGGWNGNAAGVTNLTNSTTLAGGNGGAGGNGATATGKTAGGGGGGEGGYGAIVTGTGAHSNSGTIGAGNGGAGGIGFGANALGGNGGDGGIGLVFTNTATTFTNTGTVSGGNGGAGGGAAGGAAAGTQGVGGVGIEGGGLAIVNSGTISGGLAGDGTTRAAAIVFTSGINSLSIEAGSNITGGVFAFTPSDSLILGGGTASSFDVSTIGPTAQYIGFGIYQVTGTDWTLTGTTTAATPWQIMTTGTLSTASDSALGATGNILTFEGGTLELLSGFTTSARAITIDASGGTIKNDGNTATLSDVLSGVGGLTLTGSGTLVLTANNTYTGGTTITSGTLQIGNGGTTGALTGTILDNGALVYDVDANSAQPGLISGSGTLTQEGTGVLTLTAANTYSGGTSVTQGLIDFNSAGNFGSGAITLNGGGLQWALSTSTDISGALAAIGSGGATFDTNGNTVSFAHALSGTGGITKTGAGTLILTVANTYGGTTTVTDGLIKFGMLSEFGSAPSITLNGGGLQWAAGNATDISGYLNAIGANGASFEIDDVATSVTFASVLAGTGGVTKSGAGTLILTKAETYAGATTVTGGTLQLGDGTNNGSLAGSIAIGTNGTLAFDESGSNFTVANAITGGGAITQAGTGTLTFSGNNNFTGTVASNAGLIFDATGATAMTGVISGTASLTQNAPDNSSVLTLGNANTYSGGTVITGGLINFGDVGSFGSEASPNILINGGGLQWAAHTTTDISGDLQAIGANGATFDTNGNNVAFANALTGAGGITKAGAGVLTLTQTDLYAGTTTVTGGLIDFDALDNFGTTPSITLNGGGLQWATGNSLDISSSLTAIGTNGATFDTNGNNVAFLSALTGAGGVTKSGAGVLTLTQVETYGGATVVDGGTLLVAATSAIDASSSVTVGSGGTLVVDGSAQSAGGVTVQSGGTLSGSGTLSHFNVMHGGTIAPGDGTSTGVLTIAGNGNSVIAGTLSVDLTHASSNSIDITGTGTATLTGTLVLNPTGSFMLGDHFDVVTTGGALNGEFGIVTTNGTFGTTVGLSGNATLVPVMTYNVNGNNAVVTLDAGTISPFLPAGAGANEKNVAHAIDYAMTNDNAVATFAPLANLGTADLEAQLAAFSGEIAASAQNTEIATNATFLDAVEGEAAVGDASGRSRYASRYNTVQLADNGPTEGLLGRPRASGSGGLEMWGAINGAIDDSDGNSGLGTHASNATDVGAIVGLGYRGPTNRAALGIVFGYDDVNWSLSSAIGKGRATSYQGALYGSLMFGEMYVSTVGSFASYDVTTRRTLVFPAMTNNVYHANFTAFSDGGHIELGERFNMGEGWLSPYLSGGLEQFHSPAYAESTSSGSSAYALSYTKAAQTDVTGEFGAAWDSAFGGADRDLFSLHTRLGWLHDFSAGIRDNATFEGFSGAVFTVHGTAPSKDAAHALAGIEQDYGGLALTLNAEGLVGTSSRSFGGDAGIAYRW